MASATARLLWPQTIFVRGTKETYTRVSRQIMAIFGKFTDLVEPISFDEAFLDVSDDRHRLGSATRTAMFIREKVYWRTGLTASAGVSYNKFLAKVDSDIRKPNGMFVIPRSRQFPFSTRFPSESSMGSARSRKRR